MRLGAYPAKINKGTMAFSIYKNDLVSERHRHRFEVNTQYQRTLEKNGLTFSAFSKDGMLPEIVELSTHPFFWVFNSIQNLNQNRLNLTQFFQCL